MVYRNVTDCQGEGLGTGTLLDTEGLKHFIASLMDALTEEEAEIIIFVRIKTEMR